MSVSWPVLCAARPGSFVFGRRVLRRSEWQLIVVAAVQRATRRAWAIVVEADGLEENSHACEVPASISKAYLHNN